MESYSAPLGSEVGKIPVKELIEIKKSLSDDIYALHLTLEQYGDEIGDELREKLTAKKTELKRVKRAISAIREKESRLKNKK